MRVSHPCLCDIDTGLSSLPGIGVAGQPVCMLASEVFLGREGYLPAAVRADFLIDDLELAFNHHGSMSAIKFDYIFRQHMLIPEADWASDFLPVWA